MASLFLLKMKAAPGPLTFLLLLFFYAVAGSSCASRKIYKSVATGHFGGSLNLTWIAPDKFVFLPDSDQPFTFTRANGEVIQPGAMYTDGGSLPGFLRSRPHFSSMEYAPAYIIHDWLHHTHTHNALTNGDPGDIELSATILAEGIKTLMEEDNSVHSDPHTFHIIYRAMKSHFATYATYITPWHADLPPPEEVAAMGAGFYTSAKDGAPSMSTRITKERTNSDALANLFFPHLPHFKSADKAHPKAQKNKE